MSRRKKTPEEYIRECKEKGLDLPIEDYVNSSTKITFRCKHGHTYKQYPCDHLRGHGCKYCADDAMRYIRRKTPEQYIKECKEKHVDLPIEDYKTKKIKIKFKCKKGHIYKQLPGNHLRGDGCKYCYHEKSAINLKKESNIYKEECKDKRIDLPIDTYVNNKTKIKHKCSKGHVYTQTPGDHLQGYGCPVCNESHGEKFIRNYLDNNNIKYEPQKRFKELKDKTYLSYDFYLPDYNMLIEYQGIQHYKEKEFFGGKKQFEKQQYHDNLKRKYAKNNGYKLLELKYTLDTQELVDRYLSRRIK